MSTFRADGPEGIDRQDALVDVLRQERAHVVAAESEGHLRHIVGAETRRMLKGWQKRFAGRNFPRSEKVLAEDRGR